MERYMRAQDQFEDVLRQVKPDQWDNPSPCPAWTARDIAGHEIWGLDMIRTLACGETFTDRTGAPGAPSPRDYLGPDPVAGWLGKRADCQAVLTAEALDRVVTFGPLGKLRLEQVLDSLTVDFLAHSWDLGTSAGITVSLDPGLVAHAQRWADAYAKLLRGPVGLGQELPVPEDADPQTRLLRTLGRAA
jgi:uncharacterized protein (TIGR03086 family)